MSMNEVVLVFPSSCLADIGGLQGHTFDMSFVQRLFGHPNVKFDFLPRHQVEDDPSYKQIVTYSIVQYGTRKEDMLFFSYTRGKSGGENRLKALKSIGIGGHVSEAVKSRRSPQQDAFKSSIELCWCKSEAQREIDEEITYQTVKPLLYMTGFINDDSNPVGRVHFGVVYRLQLTTPEAYPLEDSINKGEMVTLKSLIENKSEYESWSQIMIDVLAEKG